MDIEVKVDVNLIGICHGCLSHDRTIYPLGNNANMFLSLLASHRQCLVYDIEDIKLCWECFTMLKKFKSFQTQVRTAQAGLMKLYGIDSHIGTLSKLTIVTKYYYDQDIKYLGPNKLKKNNEQLDSVAIVKSEFEDVQTYSDDDVFLTDSRTDENEGKTDGIKDRLHDKIDSSDDIQTVSDNKEVILKELYEYKVKEKVKSDITAKIKKPRYNTKCCGNNVVGYYKKYATLVKTEKKNWGSSEAVRANFESVQLSDKEMEDHFCTKDRWNIPYKRLPHKCEICTIGYTTEDDLKRHNDLNHQKEGGPYKCSQCNKRQPSVEALERHWRSHSVVFRCLMCADVCKENFMRKHLNHAHTRTYDCTVCHAKFRTLNSFTVHYKQMHMMYICDYCNHTLTSKKKMEKHISEHHMTYTCKDCDRTYKNHIYYKRHCYSLHPDKVKSKYNPELSFCVECNKQFPSVDKYKTHLRVSVKHTKQKILRVPCPECGKVFGCKKYLNYHYNLFHLKKTKYYCEICDKYFARPAGLRLHRENIHLKIERVKDKICDFCGRAFSNTVVLRNHRRTHTGERPHKCPHCAAEFIQKYAMQTHVRTQHKESSKDTPYKDTKKISAPSSGTENFI